MENKIIITKDHLIVIPNGISKLLSFRRKIKIPLTHVDGATLDKDILKIRLRAWRFGTYLPGFYRAGSFYVNHEKIFFNVKNSSNPVVIQLHGEKFDRLVIGIDNPRERVNEINNKVFKLV